MRKEAATVDDPIASKINRCLELAKESGSTHQFVACHPEVYTSALRPSIKEYIQNVHCNINLSRVNVAPYLLTKIRMKESDGLNTTSQVIQFFCEVKRGVEGWTFPIACNDRKGRAKLKDCCLSLTGSCKGDTNQ